MKKSISIICLAAISFVACNNNKTDATVTTTSADSVNTASFAPGPISYSIDSVNFDSFVAYNDTDSSKRPVVMVLPEWWGLTDYPKMRAQKLADLGYFAVAVDLYGNGKIAADPKEAGELAGAFYANPQMAQARFQAALDKVAAYPQADMSRVAAIGYCFGGGMALNIARLGQDLKAVVSFHGSLMGVPADKNKVKAAILVCHGEADSFVKPQEVAAFKKQMDSAGVAYTFKSYPNATHAFTNPDATESGKKFNMPISYNAAADTASWNDMKQFFEMHLK